MFKYAAKIEKVVDADTIRFDVDLGFHIHVKATCRLARVDAPEMNTIAGQLARAFVVQQFAEVIEIRITTRKAEKYGRWLAEVEFTTPVSGQQWVNLNDLLLSSKHAAPYPAQS